MTSFGEGRAVIAGFVGAVALLAPASAPAATSVGEAFPTTIMGCPGKTLLQSASPGPSYEVPFDGIVTSWSHQADANGAQVRLKLARPTGSGFRILGESPLETVAPAALGTFAVSIPARTGDLLGLYTASGDSCGRQAPAEWGYEIATFDAPVGTTPTFVSSNTVQLNVAVTLERDCDADGLGDDTQDPDASSCPPGPQASFTRTPKDRVRTKRKRKRATFGFTANEPASFECALDVGAFASCASPFSVNVRPGPHLIQVRATDAGGNVGAAAVDAWKVKRKRRK